MDQKPNQPISPKRNGPRKQEGDFEVEDDERDRHRVESDIELHARASSKALKPHSKAELFRIGRLEATASAINSERPMTAAIPMKIAIGI